MILDKCTHGCSAELDMHWSCHMRHGITTISRDASLHKGGHNKPETKDQLVKTTKPGLTADAKHVRRQCHILSGFVQQIVTVYEHKVVTSKIHSGAGLQSVPCQHNSV